MRGGARFIAEREAMFREDFSQIISKTAELNPDSVLTLEGHAPPAGNYFTAAAKPGPATQSQQGAVAYSKSLLALSRPQKVSLSAGTSVTDFSS